MTINGTTTSEAAAVLCLVCLYIFLFKLLPKHKNQKTTTSRHYAIDFKYLRQNKLARNGSAHCLLPHTSY
jgi:hypothetical protein